MGRHSEAHRRLVDALERLPDQRSAEAVNLKVELCTNAMLRFDLAEMHSLAASACATAEALGDPAVEAAAATARVLAEYHAENADVPLDHVERAVKAVDSLADSQLAGRLDVGTNLSLAECFLERFEDSVRHAQRVVDVSRATGQGQLLSAAMVVQGMALLSLGRLDRLESPPMPPLPPNVCRLARR